MDIAKLDISDGLTTVSILVTLFSIAVAIFPYGYGWRDIKRLWQTRYIRRIFGINDRDRILIVCSELPNPVERQMVDPPREFIYLMKYGDLDAWVECLLSMERMFPRVTLNISSSGEALQNPLDLEQHIFLIGGPDYNGLTDHFIQKKLTLFEYKTEKNGEIKIKNRFTDQLFWHEKKSATDMDEVSPGDTDSSPSVDIDNPSLINVGPTVDRGDRDYGYIEKIRNPYNPKKFVIFFGGCHTTGVTSAVKFLSAHSNGKSEISDVILNNAKQLAKNKEFNKDKFALTIDATRVGATVACPTIKDVTILSTEK